MLQSFLWLCPPFLAHQWERQMVSLQFVFKDKLEVRKPRLREILEIQLLLWRRAYLVKAMSECL